MFETPEHNNAQVTELSTDELDLVTGGATATTQNPTQPQVTINTGASTGLGGVNSLVNTIAKGKGLQFEGGAIADIATQELFGAANGVAEVTGF